MSTLNQTDIDVRLQLSGCAYSDLALRFNNDLRYGRKCVTKNRIDLMLLNVYIEMLECYKLSVYASGTVDISNTDAGARIEIQIGGVSISGTYTTTSTNAATEMTALAALINSYQSVYIAAYDAINHQIVITSTSCSNLEIVGITSGKTSIITTGLTGGVCYSNCITEEELLIILDKISSLTGVCFQPVGYTYSASTVATIIGLGIGYAIIGSGAIG